MAFDADAEAEPGWSARNEYWLTQSRNSAMRRNKRHRRAEPLILTGHGVSLRIERGTLFIRNGFTHYPQERETFRFFRGDLNLPTRIIMLDGSGGVSFDVLAWLAEQGTTLIQLGWRGDVVAVIGGAGYAGNPAKIAWQIGTRDDPVKRLAFSSTIIRQKISGSIATLQTTLPPRIAVTKAIHKLEELLAGLSDHPPSDLASLRGVEGRAAGAYFGAWNGVPLAWKSTTRFPIPDAWLQIGWRASVRASLKPKNINANHPFNAMLNYAYAVRQSQLQIEAVAAGFDPIIGLMHHAHHGVPAYIFDLMEPERPKVDAALLQFALAQTFTGADFVIANDGVCRLAPQLARRVVGLAQSC
jgi:CRISP-associated protein Cas1